MFTCIACTKADGGEEVENGARGVTTPNTKEAVKSLTTQVSLSLSYLISFFSFTLFLMLCLNCLVRETKQRHRTQLTYLLLYKIRKKKAIFYIRFFNKNLVYLKWRYVVEFIEDTVVLQLHFILESFSTNLSLIGYVSVLFCFLFYVTRHKTLLCNI